MPSIPSHRSNKPHTIAFNSDGSLKFVELKIMNLRPPSEASDTHTLFQSFIFRPKAQILTEFPQEHPTSNRWEEIGVWNSEKGGKVDIKDIVWPGEALKPPEGVPERGFLTVTFLEV